MKDTKAIFSSSVQGREILTFDFVSLARTTGSLLTLFSCAGTRSSSLNILLSMV